MEYGLWEVSSYGAFIDGVIRVMGNSYNVMIGIFFNQNFGG